MPLVTKAEKLAPQDLRMEAHGQFLSNVQRRRQRTLKIRFLHKLEQDRVEFNARSTIHKHPLYISTIFTMTNRKYDEDATRGDSGDEDGIHLKDRPNTQHPTPTTTAVPLKGRPKTL